MRSSITKEDVYCAALSVKKEGVEPNTINVRSKLGGRGSQTTIHKHLTAWRRLYANDNPQDIEELGDKLSEQLELNENISAELIKANIQITEQSEEIQKLRSDILVLETRLAERDKQYNETTARLQEVANTAKNGFAESISIISEQVQAINEQAIRKVQETGQHFDNNMMDLRLELRSLKEQLKLKDIQIKKLKAEQTND